MGPVWWPGLDRSNALPKPLDMPVCKSVVLTVPVRIWVEKASKLLAVGYEKVVCRSKAVFFSPYIRLSMR